MSKIAGTTQHRTPGGHVKFDLYAESGPLAIKTCRKGFAMAYGISKWKIESITPSIRSGIFSRSYNTNIYYIYRYIRVYRVYIEGIYGYIEGI